MAAEDAEAVKEGFSWPAFVLSGFWALWHCLWLAALTYFSANVILGVLLVMAGADALASSIATLALAAIVGWTANDFRRAKLQARGYTEQAPVIAGTGNVAISRYFETDAK
ncbi:MAG: DUF2628 domain-containing protein [Pseudomonadota bacterium]|nr:DUF2628 domain-containing protein [Pseudomonadota bacterium]